MWPLTSALLVWLAVWVKGTESSASLPALLYFTVTAVVPRVTTTGISLTPDSSTVCAVPMPDAVSGMASSELEQPAKASSAPRAPSFINCFIIIVVFRVKPKSKIWIKKYRFHRGPEWTVAASLPSPSCLIIRPAMGSARASGCRARCRRNSRAPTHRR